MINVIKNAWRYMKFKACRTLIWLCWQLASLLPILSHACKLLNIKINQINRHNACQGLELFNVTTPMLLEHLTLHIGHPSLLEYWTSYRTSFFLLEYWTYMIGQLLYRIYFNNCDIISYHGTCCTILLHPTFVV